MALSELARQILARTRAAREGAQAPAPAETRSPRPKKTKTRSSDDTNNSGRKKQT